MRIDLELQQKRFESEWHKLVLNVLFTAGWLNGHAIRHLKPFGLSPQQFNVLRILRGERGQTLSTQTLSAQTIAERMIDRSSNVSRLIEKLRQKQWVTRTENPEDRRCVHVAITPEGLQLLAQIDALPPHSKVWEQRISEEEARVVNGLLDRWRD
jgi:DNA-binding MarR family transcriptional regulator